MDSWDIHAGQEQEVSGLMDRDLWEHVAGSAADDIEGGGWFSSYTGEPFSRQEMDEYGDNALKKLIPFLHPDMRVLEIGCASGITMYRIAPRVALYYGTDLSRTIIEKNKKQIEREGHRNIILSCAAAHEIDQLEEKNFDLVIMNSVVQAFHGHNYFRMVVKKAIDLLGDTGSLFIGDVMDLQLKDALIRDMAEFKKSSRQAGKTYKTKTDFSAELFISREFFQDLAQDLPVIREVHFSNKIHTIENELTRYRFDAILTIDKSQTARAAGRKTKRQYDLRSLEVHRNKSINAAVTPRDLAYVIYTSGSTGVPKGVMVEHRGVVNTLVYRKQAYGMGAGDRALQLFSYAFDGFVTSFFTPLLSGAVLVLPGSERIKDLIKIKEDIVKHGVTHFIAVPPLFRVIMESLNPSEAASLKVVALAGDKLTPDLPALAAAKNRKLEIVNEYGITEASVMSTLYRRQERDAVIKIGSPIANTQIYILDSGGRALPVDIYGELCIAGAGLARGYLNNPQLTAERFTINAYRSYRTDRAYNPKKLYQTGDLARWLSDGNLEFLGRIDSQVKIRGYRIETGEIEARLRAHEDIDDVLATVVETEPGESVLCAYVVPRGGRTPGPGDLKNYLTQRLPEYMVPVYFVSLEKIPLTGAGKIDRRALPDPFNTRTGDYAAPRNELEEKLAHIWREILSIPGEEDIGIDDNFFERGGHSLRATALIARVHQEMKVKIPLTRVFKTPHIRGMARYIRESVQEKHQAIEPSEKREYYPLTPGQQRFYMMHRVTASHGSTAYNMPQVIPLGPEPDIQRIETALKKLIQRHESLRTSFIVIDEEPVQRIHDSVDFKIQNKSFSGGPGGRLFKKAPLAAGGNEFIKPFDITHAPLLRAGIIKTAEGSHTLLVDMHHLVSDGTSQIVLAEDFSVLYSGKELPPARLQYRDFSQWQNRELRAGTGRMKEDEDYWLEHLSGRLPLLDLPTDFPRPRIPNYDGEIFRRPLGAELSSSINRLARDSDSTAYIVLLTALNILFYRYTGQEDIIIGALVSGRHHADLQRLIGLVMGPILMRNFPSAEKTFRGFLHEVNQRTLAVYEHQGYPYEELLKKLDYEDIPGRNPITEVSLIGQNMFPNGAPGPRGESAENAGMPQASKMDLTINVVEQGGEIAFVVEYRTKLFRRATIERLLTHLANIIKKAAAHPGIRLGMIDPVSEEEKRRVTGGDLPCYPLSHPQKRIYYPAQRYPSINPGIVAFGVRYPRLLDKGLVQEAIDCMLRRHDGFRLRIVEFEPFAEPFQYIAPYAPYTMEEREFASREALWEWARQKSREPFRLIDGDLFYFCYYTTGPNESGYYLKTHHINSDAGGALCMFNEIDEIYKTLEAGNAVDRSPKPSYLRFIEAELEYLDSPQAHGNKAFWHRSLLPLPEPAALPSADLRKQHTGAAIEARTRVLAVPGELRGRIHRYCTGNKTSMFKLFLAALAVYISRAAGSDDFVVGSVNHNRTLESYWQTVGMFASTIPVRIKLDKRMPFNDLVKKTGKQVNTILKNHQKYPFDRLAEEFRDTTGVDPAYLLDINLIGLPNVIDGRFTVDRYFPDSEPAPLTILINVNLQDVDGLLELGWDYQVRHFSAGDIDRLHQSLMNILADVLEDPGKELRQIDWLSAREREQLLVQFNRGGMIEAGTFAADTPLHRLIEEQAARTPDHAAVVGRAHELREFHELNVLTYRELNRKAGRLAEELRKKGVHPGDIVAIMMERSIDTITGILGILKAEAAYLPIDPSYPQERIDYMIKDSSARILLDNDIDEPRLLSSGNPLPGGAPQGRGGSKLAYIIYTSGTTGRPRGVMATHRNVVNYLNAFDRQFKPRANDVMAQQASYAFDAFVEEMYPVLLAGGALAIAAKQEVMDTGLLVDFLVRHGATMITCSPLLLGELNRHPGIHNTAVRVFISGGDRLMYEYVDNLIKIAEVYNTYGPTEATVCATYHRVGENDKAAIPIGKPVAGYAVFILDTGLQPVPMGIGGELCIAGTGVTMGYLNRPELTAERFVASGGQGALFEKTAPWTPTKASIKSFLRGVQGGRFFQKKPPLAAGGKLYKTGDRARWLSDGSIEFLGRLDRQVKIRGYRIETGEIESLLLKHPDIEDVLVAARQDNGGDLYLCAYIVTKTGLPDLKAYLAAHLPAYMIPPFFAPVEAIPSTPTGKPDIAALPDPLLSPVDDYQPPADNLEEELASLWSGVLSIPPGRISVTANFFDIGGQSIKATKLASRIHKHFNVKIPLAEIFNQPFIRSMAAFIGNASQETFKAVKKAEKKEYYALSSAQKRLYIVHRMEPLSIAYNVPVEVELTEQLEPGQLEKIFQVLVERHESFRTSFIEIDGEPMQRIHDNVDFAIEFHDLTAEQPASAASRQPFVRPFDLARAPLLRVGLVKKTEHRCTLLLDSHHIVSDGVSRELLVAEFMALFHGGQLPPLKLQYTDFSQWQNRLFASGEIAKQEKYWLQRFKGEIPLLHLPTDAPRGDAVGEAGSRIRFSLAMPLARQIEALAKKTDTTLFMVFLAAYLLLLSKYSRQDDIIVGTGTTGRNHADLEHIIGMFVNTLPLRFHIPVRGSFNGFLGSVKKHVLDAYENEDFQYEELVNRLGLERIPGRNPLFDCTFTFEKLNAPAENAAPAAQLPENTYEHTVTKFDVLLKVSQEGEEIRLMLEYKTALFKESTMEEFRDHIVEILEQVTEDVLIPLADIKISHRLLAAQATAALEEDDEFGF
jgi:bacitracin synthase 3